MQPAIDSAVVRKIESLSCWGGKPVSIILASDLEGAGIGRTNKNYVATTADGRFFVRLGEAVPPLIPDRSREEVAAQAAAAASCAPRVILAEEGVLVTTKE